MDDDDYEQYDARYGSAAWGFAVDTDRLILAHAAAGGGGVWIVPSFKELCVKVIL
jgi:hypothetical protein